MQLHNLAHLRTVPKPTNLSFFCVFFLIGIVFNFNPLSSTIYTCSDGRILLRTPQTVYSFKNKNGDWIERKMLLLSIKAIQRWNKVFYNAFFQKAAIFLPLALKTKFFVNNFILCWFFSSSECWKKEWKKNIFCFQEIEWKKWKKYINSFTDSFSFEFLFSFVCWRFWYGWPERGSGFELKNLLKTQQDPTGFWINKYLWSLSYRTIGEP